MNFLNAKYFTSQSKQQIIDKLGTVISKHNARGFNAKHFMVIILSNVNDLKYFLLLLLTHIHANDDPVSVLKRAIKFIKERCRFICYSTPFHFYTKMVVGALINVFIKWCNAFLNKILVLDAM